jgi:ribonuclease HI
MAIELNYNNTKYTTDTIIWDRDSLFVDFKSYWARLAGQISQLVAESTTNNWGLFNIARTNTIKALGIDAESEMPNNSAPINILPINTFSNIISASLHDLLKEKKLDELNEQIQKVVDRASHECSLHILTAIKKKEIEVINNIGIGKNIKQILITNDAKEANNIFIKESGIEHSLIQTLIQVNKEQLSSLLQGNTFFITSNPYLKKSYENRNIKNIILIEDIDKLSWSKLSNNSKITIHIDGASKGNPGPAAIGIAFFDNGALIDEISECIGEKTNNFAEYTALIKALEASLEKGFENIEIKSDSELVVKQIKKEYKVKDADMRELFEKANVLIDKFLNFEITHIRREENSKADKLANKALKQ